ncbi:methyltransferase [Natronoarchaeum philippinense]|uniref:tRNA(Phe) (4-demethylwyosine(37)-C(7)) aminocarboxypropyltransferase n=1 Tax=Natronoarchaeum philippinense TaxID=558529 RepID=A0A285P8J3_NATPI|nr:class I SAM-dependent methyltransferase family protein [Natronoarchaeum philippinense]SNZ18044.1 methyltransferase [Natronoarchaeum philippinense]
MPDADGRALAAVVEKPRAEVATEQLRAEGVYDDARKVVEYGAETVALPVTAAPAETDVREVVVQTDPERRGTTLPDLLAERGWSDAEIERAPGSWAVIGSVVLVTLEDCPREAELGDALLELHGEADTVLAHEGVSGERREPDSRVIAGDPTTETIHTEHGTRYALDLREVMFSPGNKAERARMADVIAGEVGPAVETGGSAGTDAETPERVFDMFAGIGYFTLPMARAGADVVAAEINPASYRYLIENAVLNDVQDRVEAYRADCRDVEVDAVDRVVMGYYEAHEYLDTAVSAVASGGVVHVHEATPEVELWDRPVGRIEDAADRAGRGVEIEGRRKIKSHSEGVWHVVVDARIV